MRLFPGNGIVASSIWMKPNSSFDSLHRLQERPLAQVRRSRACRGQTTSSGKSRREVAISCIWSESNGVEPLKTGRSWNCRRVSDGTTSSFRWSGRTSLLVMLSAVTWPTSSYPAGETARLLSRLSRVSHCQQSLSRPERGFCSGGRWRWRDQRPPMAPSSLASVGKSRTRSSGRGHPPDADALFASMSGIRPQTALPQAPSRTAFRRSCPCIRPGTGRVVSRSPLGSLQCLLSTSERRQAAYWKR